MKEKVKERAKAKAKARERERREGESIVVDFCADMQTFAANETFRFLVDEEERAVLDLLAAETADINGGINSENGLPQANGMLDCAYELGLLAAVLADPELDLGSGSLPGQNPTRGDTRRSSQRMESETTPNSPQTWDRTHSTCSSLWDLKAA